jgi:hypothetical protein
VKATADTRAPINDGKPQFTPTGRTVALPNVLVLAFVLMARPLAGQLNSWENDHVRIITFGSGYEYLLPHVVRTFENAYAFHRDLFRFASKEKITLIVHDFGDFSEAGADGVPRNRVTISIAPSSYVYETVPSNERLNSAMNHELVHIAAIDKSSKRDRFFRRLFSGKVLPTADQPLSMLYSYATAPRRYAPRWYHEGIAAFMETWMAGGLGRALGSYDEMVWRTKVMEGTEFHDPLTLESEGVKTDFQVGALSYLYGTRFITYLVYNYGTDSLLQWIVRDDRTAGSYARQFRRVYGHSLEDIWQEWIAWERQFQRDNLDSLRRVDVSAYSIFPSPSLGSVSRTYYHGAKRALLTATHPPEGFAYIGSFDPVGRSQKLALVQGPTLYDVTSLAYDSAGRIFYTANNNEWRDLHVLDIERRTTRRLIDNARIGDLAFNRRDRSLWGVRHYNGLSSLVRIPAPYSVWNLVFAFPYGRDIYDIDVSPDGEWVSASMVSVSGRHVLVRFEVADLLWGRVEPDTLFEFDDSAPSNFVYTSDGTALIGSSYYTGVSNAYRFDLGTRSMQILTNTPTGLFRPLPLGKDTMLVMLYTGLGFVPVILPAHGLDTVGTIRYLGQLTVERRPELKKWLLSSPTQFEYNGESRRYNGWSHMHIESVYPIIEGYQNRVAAGFRINLSDPTRFHQLYSTISLSRGSSDERYHARLNYNYLNWTIFGAYNRADFYDLFGPTKTSRKGYDVGLQYQHTLTFDGPKSTGYQLRSTLHAGAERLPDFQEVDAPIRNFATLSAEAYRKILTTSLGGVDAENGYLWKLIAGSYLTRTKVYPQCTHVFDFGFPLPVRHSAIWVRTAAGAALGPRDEPLANFYFGGFGNNRVDRGEAKRYRLPESFPGRTINSVSAHRYARIMAEWTLPPVVFRSAGNPALYANFAHASVFSSALMTRTSDGQRTHRNLGGQLDVRIVALSYLKFTLSSGYAMAFSNRRSDEWMVSLKIH